MIITDNLAAIVPITITMHILDSNVKIIRQIPVRDSKFHHIRNQPIQWR